MPQSSKSDDDKPDPIAESIRLANEEHDDKATNRLWFWWLVVPVVVFFFLSVLYILWASIHTP